MWEGSPHLKQQDFEGLATALTVLVGRQERDLLFGTLSQLEEETEDEEEERFPFFEAL